MSSRNILDIDVTTESDRVIDVKLFPPFPNYGHALIFFTYLFQDVEQGPDTDGFRQLNWSLGNYRNISTVLDACYWEYEFMHLDPSQIAEHLLTILSDLIRIYVHTKTTRSHVPPWHRQVPRHLHN